MGLVVRGLHILRGQMRVDHRGFYVLVSEQLLDDTQVATALEHVRSEGVARCGGWTRTSRARCPMAFSTSRIARAVYWPSEERDKAGILAVRRSNSRRASGAGSVIIWAGAALSFREYRNRVLHLIDVKSAHPRIVKVANNLTLPGRSFKQETGL